MTLSKKRVALIAIFLAGAIHADTAGKRGRVTAKRGRAGRALTSTPDNQNETLIELRDRITDLQQQIDKLSAEMEVMRAETQSVLTHHQLDFSNRFYIRGGLSIITPRARTFSFNTDTGLGAYVGVGHYLGDNHVVEFNFEWDLYPAMSIKYRYEFHMSYPRISWAPELGMKVRAASIPPWDNYLAEPSQIKNSFLMFGGMVGFTVEQSVIVVEVLYLTNQQSFLFTNVGLHYFL